VFSWLGPDGTGNFQDLWLGNAKGVVKFLYLWQPSATKGCQQFGFGERLVFQ